MNVRTLAALSSALLVAAGCGGSSKPPPAERTISYAGPTGSASLTATVDKNGLASGAASLAQGFSGFAGAAAGIAAPAGAVALGASPRPAFVKNALAVAADARHRAEPGAAMVTGVSTLTLTASCAGGGSLSVSALDADGLSSTTSPGDYVQVAFASCDDGAGKVAHGSFRLTIDATPGDDFVADATSITKDATFGLTLAFHDFWSSDAGGAWSGLDGSLSVQFAASVSAQTLTYQVSGTSIEGASGIGGVTAEAFRIAALPVAAGGDGTSFHDLGREVYSGMGTASAAVTETQWDLDARVCTLEFRGCLNLLTSPTFAEHDGAAYPYTGALTVSDDAGDFVKVAATSEDGSATLSWSLDGGSGSLATCWPYLAHGTSCP
jgi:hypothetical protein